MTSTVHETQSLPNGPNLATATPAQPFPVEGTFDIEAAEGPRRMLNAMAAVVMLVAALPIFVLVSVLIKLTSPGPVFYTQTRIGVNRRLPNESKTRYGRHRTCDLGGRPFVIYKFRTMRLHAERESGVVWASKNDPRVTVIGKVLRQTRLDELPQLINVLNGDMNIVGPRPERPSIFARLADELDGYWQRQRVRPGITGLAQIRQQYDTSVEDVRRKLEYDLEYIARQNVWTDLVIMLKTVPVILFRRGGW